MLTHRELDRLGVEFLRFELPDLIGMLNAFCESLRQDFVRLFTTVKEHEIDCWRHHISDWEIAEYREIY